MKLMPPTSKYVQTHDGTVHLVSAFGVCETLCRVIVRTDEQVVLRGELVPAWKEVKHGPVTCGWCENEIKNCRGVRTDVEYHGN